MARACEALAAFSKLEPLKTRRLMKENWLKIF